MNIYFDHNATTPVDEKVLEAMLPFFSAGFGNASSRHTFGRAARQAVDGARQQVAAALGAHPSQIRFVSGGTEANNAILRGVIGDDPRQSRLAISAIEHPSVRATAQALQRSGTVVDFVPVDRAGLIDQSAMREAVASGPTLISLMLANNETGVIQPVESVASAAREAGIWIHTDAVQALGKVPLSFTALGVHAMSLSAHKIGGPKGIGALVLDKRLDLTPLMAGGGQEKGWRGGTENVPGIVGFGLACELATQRLQQFQETTSRLREQLERGLLERGAAIFGADAPRLPNTSFFAIPGIDGEALVMQLDRAGFGIASGAACSSASVDPSPVLLAMGVERELAKGAVRVSLGLENTAQQVAEFLAVLDRVKRDLMEGSTVFS